MPVPIIVLTGLSLGLSLATGGYAIIKPSLFIAAISGLAVCLFLFCLKRDVRRPVEVQMLTIAVAMPLLAWSLPSLGLLFIVMCLWVPLAAGQFNRIVPVYLFSLLLLPGLDETLSISSIKLLEFSVHNALGVGAAIAIFLHPGKAKCRIQWDVVAFSVVALLAVALSRETSISHHIRTILKVVLDLGLPYYIVSRGLRGGNELRAAMLWLAAGGVIIALILLFELWKGWPVYHALYWVYEVPTLLLVKERGGLLRAGGPFIESTSAAMVLAICILALYFDKGNFRNRHGYYVLLAVSLAGLVAPQSRGAWVGLCLAIGVADFLKARYFQLTVKAFALGGLLSSLFLAAHFSSFLAAQLGMSAGTRDTTDYRQHLFDRGLEEFAKRPFTGYPDAELRDRLADLVQGEGIVDFVNAYIWIMLISGIGGLIIFAGAFMYFLYMTGKAGRFRSFGQRNVEAEGNVEPGGNIETGVFAFAAIAMSMEMFFFTSFGTRPAMYLFVLFGFAAAFIRSQQPAKRTGGHRIIGPLGRTAMQPSK